MASPLPRTLERRTPVTLSECVNQPTPFLQRFCLLRFVCGERTNDAAMLARWFEQLGPLDLQEAEVIAAGWPDAGTVSR